MEYCRAGLCILNCQCMYLVEFFPVRMRIFPAGFRTVLINTAIIVASQEGARHWTEYILFIFVDMQMSLNNFVWFDTQCLCNPFDITVRDARSQCPAAIPAVQAIDRIEYLLVDGMYRVVQFPVTVLLDRFEKVFVSFSTFLALSGRELISIKWLCFNLKGQM